MTIPLRQRAGAPLATSISVAILMSLAGQSFAADASTARRPPDAPQRLEWRITELEGELAALRRFAQQQDASLDHLQSEVDASVARHAAENFTLAALWALVSGFAVWQAVRRWRR